MLVTRRDFLQGAAGLAFVGMRYQYRVGSALLGGVGEDAAYVASETVKFLRSGSNWALRDLDSAALPERIQPGGLFPLVHKLFPFRR